MNDFLSWMASEAGAAWVASLVLWIGLGTKVLTSRYRRSVSIAEDDKWNIISIKGAERSNIALLYNDAPVRSLTELTLTLENRTNKVIDNLELEIAFSGPVAVLDAAVTFQRSETAVIAATKVNGLTLGITLPFANSALHDEALRISILLDGHVDTWRASGHGRDWSLTQQGITTKKRLLRRAAIAAYFGLGLNAAGGFAGSVLSMPPPPRALPYLGLAIATVALVWLQIVVIMRSARRSRFLGIAATGVKGNMRGLLGEILLWGLTSLCSGLCVGLALRAVLGGAP